MRKVRKKSGHNKKLIYISLICTAILLALFMLPQSTRKGLLGFFGWAICAYIPILFVVNLLLLIGLRPNISKKRVWIHIALFVSILCTLHILLTKPLFADGESYILSPIQGYGTVGGMLVSLITAPFKLILKRYNIMLATFFVLTSLIGLATIYPFVLNIKDFEKNPPKDGSKAKSNPPSLADNKKSKKLFVADLDSIPVKAVEDEHSSIIFEPKVPLSRVDLFSTLRDENERHLVKSQKSAEILFSNEPPKKEEPRKYNTLSKLAEGELENNLYTNQGRQRLFEDNMRKVFGTPDDDFDTRYPRAEFFDNVARDVDNVDTYINYPQNNTLHSSRYAEQDSGDIDIIDADIDTTPTSIDDPLKYIQTPLKSNEYSATADYYAGSMGNKSGQTAHSDKNVLQSQMTNNPLQFGSDKQPKYGVDNSVKQSIQTDRVISSNVDTNQRQAQKLENIRAEQPNIFGNVKETQPILRRKPYIAPPLDMLTAYTNTSSDFPEDYAEMRAKINETLASAGIQAEVINAKKGPTFTRYEIRLEPGQPVQKITALEKTLLMRLCATSIRILAPIRGKDAVGIELPNTKREIVGLRSVIGSKEFHIPKSGIQLAFGKNLEGTPFVADLAKMPHLLVAGATGTGKSVFINSIIMSILYKYSPEDVRLLLIDPKRVELSVYQNLPNLLMKETVKEPQHAVNLLRWLTQEMDNRFAFLEKYSCNDIDLYNDSIRDKAREPKLPRIVLVIDEMADLMIKGKGQVEEYIVRIAQLGRACGIHLVLATQRPTVNVITGLIKANILARVAFTVKTNQDSRIVLDEGGAESLLGSGDMLFSYHNDLDRIQGAYVENKDIRAICEFIKANNDADFNESIINEIKAEPKEETETVESRSSDDRDRDFESILKRVLKTFILEKRASVSSAQSKHNVGYIRAKKILNALTDRGYVSEEDGNRPREVLITLDEFYKVFGKDE